MKKKLSNRIRRARAEWGREGRPLTPRMREALRMLVVGATCPAYTGRPTKQRLVKLGLATYVNDDGDWDGPIIQTEAGARAIGAVPMPGAVPLCGAKFTGWTCTRRHGHHRLTGGPEYNAAHRCSDGIHYAAWQDRDQSATPTEDPR